MSSLITLTLFPTDFLLFCALLKYMKKQLERDSVWAGSRVPTTNGLVWMNSIVRLVSYRLRDESYCNGTVKRTRMIANTGAVLESLRACEQRRVHCLNSWKQATASLGACYSLVRYMTCMLGEWCGMLKHFARQEAYQHTECMRRRLTSGKQWIEFLLNLLHAESRTMRIRTP